MLAPSDSDQAHYSALMDPDAPAAGWAAVHVVKEEAGQRAPEPEPPPPFHSRSVAVAFLICRLTFGAYCAYDLPATLPNKFKAMAGSNTKYEFFYTAYSAPSIIMPLLVGALADSKLGPHACVFAVSYMVTIGCFLVALGCTRSVYMIVLSGRFIMGLGGEATFALQQTLCTWWTASRHVSEHLSGRRLRYCELLAYKTDQQFSRIRWDQLVRLCFLWLVSSFGRAFMEFIPLPPSV